MTDNDTTPTRSPKAHLPEDGGRVPVNTSRRRLLTTGLVTTPVLLTLNSRTVWGGALCSPSAFNSVTFASHHPDESKQCAQLAGKKPQTWQSETWPYTYQKDVLVPNVSVNDDEATLVSQSSVVASAAFGEYNGYYPVGGAIYSRSPSSFNGVFGNYLSDDNTSLLEVLHIYPAHSIEAQAVAALLNANAGLITLGLASSTMAENKVKEIFATLLSGAGYRLETGQVVYWDTDPNNVGFTLQDYFNTHAG